MQPFTVHTGVAAPLMRANVDTDAIIPSREMKRVSKQGLGEGLFAAWRYTLPGSREPNPDFVLNRPGFADTSILLSGSNFGCGSSREHAVWALQEYGIRAIIAPSFGAIFFQNCVRNGIAPIVLEEPNVQALADWVATDPQTHRVTVDLQHCMVKAQESYGFTMAENLREMLLKGQDAISLTLTLESRIMDFENHDRRTRPWVYSPLSTNH